jgi:hypothetical protein
MNEDELIWNRACGRMGPEAGVGDRALSALLRAHGLSMNGGVLHAVECLSASEIEQAASRYRFFGFNAAASLLLGARRILESGQDLADHEALLDRDYHRLIPDDASLYARFEEHRRSHPRDFAPPS